DIGRIDREGSGWNAAVEQAHGDRVRLFARRAGNAQHAEDALWPGPGGLGCDPAADEAERLYVAEEPGLRNDDLLHQGLEVLGGMLETFRERGAIRHATGRHLGLDRALDRAQTDRSRVHADAAREQRPDSRERRHGSRRNPSESASRQAGSTNDSGLRSRTTPPSVISPWRMASAG